MDLYRRLSRSNTDPNEDEDQEMIADDFDLSYPFFNTTDPALRAAYAYGDPRGGTQYPDPTTIYGGSVAPVSPGPASYGRRSASYDRRSASYGRRSVSYGRRSASEDVDHVERELAFTQLNAERDNPKVDPDYDSGAEDETPSDVSEDEEADYVDADEYLNSKDTGRGGLKTRGRATIRGRGGRGRGKIGGRARGRGRGKSTGTGRGQGSRRGRGRGRGSSSARSRGRGSRGARGAFGDLDDGEGDDGEERRGGGVLGRKHGPRAMAEPTAEFKNYNGLMNKAYISEDYDTALKYGLEAIKVNPEMFHVHATIAEILMRKNRKDDALGALYVGVHATRDAASWWYVVEKLIDVGGDTKETRQRLQDCYSSLLDMNPEDYKARFGRMRNYLLSGQKTRARNECLNLLKRQPFDTEALIVLADICFSMEEPSIAIPGFEKFFSHATEQGLEPDQIEQTWKLLDLYLELLIHTSLWDDALTSASSISRWILGRSHDTFWDSQDDDREWDFDDEPRRIQVDNFTPGDYPLDAYGEGLPVEIRQKLGLIRLGIGAQYYAEALDHFEVLEPDDDSPQAYVYEYPDLFREIGDALREEQLHQDALRFYEPLQRQPQVLDARFYFDIAICYQALKRDDDVKRTMEALRLFKGGKRDANFYVGLAKLYQSQGKETEMHYLCRQLKRMGKSDLVLAAGLPLPRDGTRAARAQTHDSESSGHESTTEFRQVRARSVKMRKEKRAEYNQFKDGVIRQLYENLTANGLDFNSGSHEVVTDWINTATEMLEEFRSEKLFFPREKGSKFTGFDRWQRSVVVPAGDILFRESVESEQEIPQYFRNIHFDQWLDLLLQLALQHARLGRADECYDVLRTIQAANIFVHDPDRMQKARNLSLACSVILEDEKQLIEETRWFIKQMPYTADAYRLFSTMNRFCRGPITYYNSGPEQKFVLRAIKTMDFSLLPSKHRAAFLFTDGDRAKWAVPVQDSANPYPYTEHDPTLLVLYGHMMFVAATYSSALTYYFRAYVLRPDDPILNLCIAVSYVQMGYKRQAENRHYQIQQGLSFLYRYYELRTKNDIAVQVQEAEFNMALVWHTLGLQHLALPAYQRCVALSERVQEERLQAGGEENFIEDLAAEAAFAIQGILATGGDCEGARRVTEQYLVL